jgi:hypothetical protein
MRLIKYLEDFKQNNEEGSLITLNDIIKCIKGEGVVYATAIKDLPGIEEEEPLRPVSVDEDGLVTIEYDGNEYGIDLHNIKKIDF